MDPEIALRTFFATYSSRLKPGSTVLIAVSAGPDSTVLAHSLHRLQREFPYRFSLAHVNHALRGADSRRDQAFVSGLAERFEWPCWIRQRPVRLKAGNLEEAARVSRYNALFGMARSKKAQLILTAHTQNDHAETIMMNLLRGSGLSGLAGMEPWRWWAVDTKMERRSRVARLDGLRGSAAQIAVGRPFLEISKAAVLNYAEQMKIRFRLDKSNTNPDFFRNWLRQRLFPLVEERAPGFADRLVRLATLVRDEEAFWENQMEGMRAALLRATPAGTLLDFEGLLSYSAAQQRRFLRRSMGGDSLTFDGVERLRRWMASNPAIGRRWQGKQGWMAVRHPTSKRHFRITKELNK